MLRRITRDQVTIGMFVHALEGSWFDHSFWRPRFHLSTLRDLARIHDSTVLAVIIDESRGLALDPPVAQTDTLSARVIPSEAAAPVDPLRRAPEPRALARPSLALQRARSFAEERDVALAFLKHSSREMKRLFAAAHMGDDLHLAAFTPLVSGIMASVARNPYALIAITRLKKRDEYTYVHSLAVSALMTNFARSLGLAEEDVFNLGLAGLLHDIGKMVVPDKILKKPESLTDAEWAVVRTHPEQGYRILSQNPSTPDIVLDVCRHHHERLDGSGYPFGLKGDAISRVARIGGICDVYDALTSNRTYKAAWTAEEAVSRMAEWTGHFDADLLFAFMKSVGVYPPGILVQLRSNRLAVTMPNGRRASRPKVRAFYCTRERVQTAIEDVVIEDNLALDQIMSEQYPLDWGITDWPLVAEQLMTGTVPRLAGSSVPHTRDDKSGRAHPQHSLRSQNQDPS